MKEIEKLLIEEFKKNNVNYDTKPMADYVDDSFTDVLKSVIGVVKKLNYIPCCKSDSEQLCHLCNKPLKEGVSLDYCTNLYCIKERA